MIKKQYETIHVDVQFLLLFTTLWTTFARKREKRDLAKVAQSVVNSSKNGTSILNSSWYFLSFFFKNIVFYSKKEGPRTDQDTQNHLRSVQERPQATFEKLLM